MSAVNIFGEPHGRSAPAARPFPKWDPNALGLKSDSDDCPPRTLIVVAGPVVLERLATIALQHGAEVRFNLR